MPYSALNQSPSTKITSSFLLVKKGRGLVADALSGTPARYADTLPAIKCRRFKESPMSDSIISVEHVFKSVTDSTGTLDILRDIDFVLNARETVAIVGASGSG